MINTRYPVLCGGTFLAQLLQSRRPTATSRQHTQGASDVFHEQDVLLGLVKLVQSDYLKPAGNTFKTYTTNFKKCAEYTPDDLKFDNEAVITGFLVRLTTNYSTELNNATGFVRQFIDVGTTAQNDVLLVKRLIEIIRDDESIPSTAIFAVAKDGTAMQKTDLVNITEVYLPAFILDVWKFIVTERKNNSEGAITISKWFPSRYDRYEGIDGSTITQEMKVECGKYVASSVQTADTALSAELAPEATKAFIMPNVYTYLHNAEEKYSIVKTLLYNDQPKKFYSFYVCNRIRYTVLDNKEESRASKQPRNRAVIENVTVKKIRELTRFAIIAGTGGLGKSMMMRHLMLDAIANFDDLKCFPVFVPLKDFDETATSLFEYIYSKIGVFDENLSKEQFEQMLAQGSCLLLLDGLDEVGASSVKKFERELVVLTDKYSKNMFILSSRPFQSFVSYERYSLLRLMPFDRRQAMQLVENLEFRHDEPAIKAKFQAALDKTLFRTHRSFTENPLLLTIMLLTFEQYAEVPLKEHIFYREAFEVLARRHDASKGAYKRALKTGLSVDTFADYFAELCFRSYNDEKFEMTAEEFDGYFSQLNARIAVNDEKTTASDFREDLCSNLCLMYFEGNSYHFAHRSFQEYFCALFFSKQKDKFIAKLGDFFEKNQRRMFGDRTFYMLYDMATEKVEEYIFLPFLTSLFEKFDNADGYWTFLEEMYPRITYSSDEEYLFSYTIIEPRSFLLSAILDIIELNESGIIRRGLSPLVNLPYYEELEVERIPRYKQVAYITIHGDEEIEKVEDEESDFVCEFRIADIRKQSEEFEDLLDALNDNKIIFKKQYLSAQKYMKEIVAKQKYEDDSLLNLLREG